MKPYLRPTAPIAPDVLLTADPGLAMELAQRVMVKPLMANHHHGLWGYSGQTEDGRALTVQAGGIGAPSTAAIASELAGHGARRIVRVGTCAALDPGLAEAEAVVVTSAMGADGTSVALGVDLTEPDAELTGRLQGRGAAIVSYDLGASAGQAMREAWLSAGIAAADLETASLFAMAGRLGLAAAAVLVMAETSTGLAADETAVKKALLDAGTAANAAFASARSIKTTSAVV